MGINYAIMGNKIKRGGILMDPVIQKFRSALGGFHRRDVLQYIERLSAGYRKELAALEKELARSEKERLVLESTLAGLEDEKGTVAAEEARVRASLEESTAALTRLRGELGETETNLAAARSELVRCQREVAELAPMAKNYEELKDRVATVELDAHRKAQATVDEARAEARALRQETARWTEEVLARYGGLRQSMDELMQKAKSLAELEEGLRGADERAAQLRDRCKESGAE